MKAGDHLQFFNWKCDWDSIYELL